MSRALRFPKYRSPYAPNYEPGYKGAQKLAVIRTSVQKHPILELACGLAGCPTVVHRNAGTLPRSGRVFCSPAHHYAHQRGETFQQLTAG